MDKALTYSVVEKKNPIMQEMPGKFYARAQARGVAGIREMSDRIQKMCTVTRADVMAVLIALEDVVADSLANGEIVRLGELGSMQVSLSSTGVEKKEDFHEGLITNARILFRGGTTLKTMLATMSYEKVEPRSKEESDKGALTEPEPGGKSEDEHEGELMGS